MPEAAPAAPPPTPAPDALATLAPAATADSAVRPARNVAIATMASRILGLVRDKATVYCFATPTADALYLAWTIPNLFRRLFGEGALSAALVPVLAETEAKQGAAARSRVARSVIWSLIAFLAPLTLALLVALLLIPQRWLLAFFESDTTGLETLRLLRWTLPYLLLICVAGQMQAVANLAGRFFFPALAPAIGNVAWIAGALVAASLAPPGEADAIWVAIAILAGGVLQVACQALELRRAGEDCLTPAPIRTSEVREVSRRMAPMVLGLAASQVNLLVDRFVAEFMVPGSGAVTQLYLGNRLMQLPLGVIGVALGTAVYPALARAAARHDHDELGSALAAALRTAATLCIPALLGLIALASPIMGLLFEGGEFTRADALASGACMAAYAPTLLFQTAVLLLARADYARGRERRPVVVSAIAVAVNVALSFALVLPFGAPGLAAATTIATLVNAALLARGLSLGRLDAWSALIAPVLRVSAAATAMLAVVLLARRLLPPGDLVTTATGILLGLATFFAAGRLLCRRELDELMRLLRPRGNGPPVP